MIFFFFGCSERTKQSILDYSVIEDFAMEHGIFDDKDVRMSYISVCLTSKTVKKCCAMCLWDDVKCWLYQQ